MNMKIWIPFILICLLLLVLLVKLIRQQTDTIWQKITLLTSWVYLFFICRICFAPAPFSFPAVHEIHYFLIHGMIVNLVPFQAMDTAFWLNVLMTVPAGIYYMLIFNPRRLSVKVWLGIGTGLTIETTQFIINWFVQLGRWVEVDDLITNACGVWIGMILIYALSQFSTRLLVNKFSLHNMR
ncbi:integral membrane protein [Paucilactobacillus vaccinostercus DSM 20634]|uniref:Integral membrane protein n=2 Tax=Paucilactobacillus vaccinostercus TaxID=176291 RepID=A0A0R1ZZL0_9LACO|nr:integral membrane protein [Paucilactobacillus vaccinostercus DSM 20634]